jgi:hypothetical protein
MRIIACRIEWHWLFITPGRKKGVDMIDELAAKGQPPNSPELMALIRKLNRHCMRVSVLTEKYISLDNMKLMI